MSEKPLLVLIDGSSYLYRAFHAMPPLTNSRGQPTGATYGVLRMVRKLIDEEQPQRIGVIFDAKGKTFRHDIYPQYKAQRPPMPDDLRVQIEPLHTLIKALGIPLQAVQGIEADDVIGTLARRASAQGYSVLISTGDKDMAQLVSGDISLINTMNDVRMDAQGVVDKFGVEPDQIIDYLALMGDKVDNIPGVPSVGPKTAVKWLQQYQTMQGVIEHAAEVKGKIGDKLRGALAGLPMSYQLATIKCDCDLGFAIDDLQIGTSDVDTLSQLYSELEFNSWLEDLPTFSSQPQVETIATRDYQLILTQPQLDEWIEKITQADIFAFDTETDNLDYMQANLVGMSFSVTPGEAAYLPLTHDYPGAPDQLSLEYVLAKLTPILASTQYLKVGHNLKYDMSVLARHDIELAGIAHDTMLLSYILDSTASRHDLDTLCTLHLKHKNIKFEDVAGKGVKQITFNQVDLAIALDYAAEDADMCLQLYQLLQPRLEKNKQQYALYQNIEIPLLSYWIASHQH